MRKFYALPVFIFIFLTCFTLNAQVTIRYVKPNATGSGLSWDAAGDLQTMINASDSNDQIWVMKGVYSPTVKAAAIVTKEAGDAPSTDRDMSFILKSGVEIYGGFAGTEGSLAERDFTNNVTTLSGTANDAYHVVIASGPMGSAVLDGFTITGGNADGLGTSTILVNGNQVPQSSGGGLYCRLVGTAQVLRNLIITANKAGSAAGVYLWGSAPVMTDIKISDNNATNTGGGLFLYGTSSSPKITSVTITENTSVNAGGGVYNSTNSSPVYLNSTISKNTAGTTGGGVYNAADAKPVFIKSTISGNSGTSGGGMHIFGGEPTLRNVTISENEARTGSGGGIYNAASVIMDTVAFNSNKSLAASAGGMYNASGSEGNFKNLSFTGNTAYTTAGAMYVHTSKMVFVNAFFSGNKAAFNNTASGAGGAVYMYGSSETDSCIVTFINSVFYNNSTSISGGGAIYASNNSFLTAINSTFYLNSASTSAGAVFIAGQKLKAYIYNSIFYGNTAASDVDIAKTWLNSTLTLRNTLTQAYGTAGTNGVIKDNPLFASTDPANAAFLHLSLTSPAVNKGVNADIPEGVDGDLAGNYRIAGTRVDLGAYEYGSTPLPVSLMFFTAKLQKGNGALLTWATASETNNDRFSILRSTDGVSFDPLTTVPAKGNGTSTVRQDYSFVDPNPQQGINYYKLVQYDKDGTATDYGTQFVTLSLSKPVAIIYPNPSPGEFKVLLPQNAIENVAVKVIDMQGKTISDKLYSSDGEPVVVTLNSNVNAGQYIVIVSSGAVSSRQLITVL